MPISFPESSGCLVSYYPSLSRRPPADQKAWGLWERDWRQGKNDFFILFVPIWPFPLLFFTKSNPNTGWSDSSDETLLLFTVDTGKMGFFLPTEILCFLPSQVFFANWKVTIWNPIHKERAPSWIASCRRSCKKKIITKITRKCRSRLA